MHNHFHKNFYKFVSLVYLYYIMQCSWYSWNCKALREALVALGADSPYRVGRMCSCLRGSPHRTATSTLSSLIPAPGPALGAGEPQICTATTAALLERVARSGRSLEPTEEDTPMGTSRGDRAFFSVVHLNWQLIGGLPRPPCRTGRGSAARSEGREHSFYVSKRLTEGYLYGP